MSTIPSGSRALAQEHVEWLSGCPGDDHAQHVGAGVVQPVLPRLVQQRQRAQPADPLVGFGRTLRPRWSVAQFQRAHRLEQRLRPRRGEVHSESEAEGEHIAERDRAFGRNGLAVDRATRVGEHTPVGELGQQVVDRLVEAQPALLDEE